MSYTYDDADELTAVGGTSYGYGSNGNQTSRGSDTYTFDHENRMTQSVTGGVTSSSVYYGHGRATRHTVNGASKTFVWGTYGKLPVALQDGTNTYVYGLDRISATDGSGNQTYLPFLRRPHGRRPRGLRHDRDGASGGGDPVSTPRRRLAVRLRRARR